MIHFASDSFWKAYEILPTAVQKLADKQYDLLKQNAQHPSLHLKKVGRYWSVWVGIYYRALAIEVDEGLLWFWIGSHADYDRLILKS